MTKATVIGGALALLGLLILLKLLVGADFLLLRLALALALIYVGGRLAIGTLKHGLSNFGGNTFRLSGEISSKESFGVALGAASIDLSEAVPPANGHGEVELSVMLGGARVFYSPETPLVFEVQCMVGDAKLPDGNSVFAGTLTYRTPAAASAERHIRVKLTVFCANVRFVAGSLPVEGPSEEAKS